MIKRNFQTILLFFTTVLLISLVSCDPGKKYEKEEKSKIEDYLNSNSNLNFVLQSSGLYYLEVLAGTGRTPVLHDTAYVKYTGMFLDGTVFDTNVGKADSLIFPVAEGWTIAGFDEGITLMKEGGKATFLIPSKLAYGPSGYYSINGYTPLLYDVELVHVTPGPGK
ncbi:MAG: FKBP-type peptidyl-prolyl cis-trans isomerase [Bacteroidia bacterium]|nr:FKBP-type peptidyl-prolyl cis-trans isomerase [Bacteroidia bacterium]